MTESEWLTCTRPHGMLDFLESRKASGRKLRLFSGACCRRLERVFLDSACCQVIEVSDRFADGQADEEELSRAGGVINTLGEEAVKTGYEEVLRALGSLGIPKAPLGFERVLRAVRSREKESRCQCNLLRDVFGNPFRKTAINRAWLAWNDGTVRKLAQVIYDTRAFDRLPLLADALEDAGCTDADILSHCRQSGEHVRGCWVVDALLGKE